MKSQWKLSLSLLFAGERTLAQKVIEVPVQHFQSFQAGPFQPLLAMGFGTPPQIITGIFDTGSADTIIPQAGSAVCQLPNQQCRDTPTALGDFDPAKSQGDVTVVEGARFNASFSGGDGFDGGYINTTVSFGEDKVPDAQIALATNGSLPGDFPQFAIFGTGPSAAVQTDQKYQNLPQRMKDAGVIKGNSFSVVFDPTPFGNGSVIFGGIDRSKFRGELQQVPIEPDNTGTIFDFVINMTSIHLAIDGKKGGGNQTSNVQQDGQPRQRQRRSDWSRKGKGVVGTFSNGQAVQEGGTNCNEKENSNNGTENGQDKGDKSGSGNGSGKKDANGKATRKNLVNLGIQQNETFTLIDTGGVGITLPRTAVINMAEVLNTTFSNEDGLGLVDCNTVGDSQNKLVLGFNKGKTAVNIPLSQMQVSKDLLDEADRNSGKCVLAISATEDNLNSMGFPFFSSTYTVFDLESNSLWLAPAVHGRAGNGPASKLEVFP